MTEFRKPWNGARMSPELEFKIANLPDSPGCYLMKSKGKIIYVGKAVNLRNRVSQYFHYSAQHTTKVRAMVEKIDDLDIILVDSEMEAFALECNLIKLHMPHYNILLKDDKAYPYIRVNLAEDFPLVDLARRQEKDGAKYYGPYQGSTVVREVLDVVRMVFPIRVCKHAINPDKPRRPCVHHQVGQCPAPCAGLVPKEDYRKTIDGVIDFLNGKYASVLSELKDRMTEASQEMNYERAALYRDRIRAVEAVMQKQKAISTAQADQDIIAVLPHEADAMVQLIFVRSGRMIGSERFTLEGAGDENPGEILTQFMLQYYGPEITPPREILLSHTPPEHDVIEQLLTEQHGARTYILTPRRGEKLKLVGMAVKNLKDEAKKLDRKNANSRARTIGALETLQEILNLPTLPRRIEGYDISNTQGALSVASEVVMVDGVRGIPPLPHQDGGGRQRLRQHVRGHHPPPVPRAGRAGRAARTGARPPGRQVFMAPRPDPGRWRPGPAGRRPGGHAGPGAEHTDGRPCQAHRGDRAARGGREPAVGPPLPRPARIAEGSGRESSLRHHPPQGPAGKGQHFIEAGRHSRRGREAQEGHIETF